MSALSCPRPVRVLLGAVACAALLLVGTPAQAHPRHPAPKPDGAYYALGDSYASGEGLAPYDPDAPSCDRSVDRSYPALLSEYGPRRFDDLTSLACTMSTSADVALKQLPLLDRDARTITLTVGGNDVGFAKVLASCLYSTDATIQAALPGGKGCRLVAKAPVDGAIDNLGGPVALTGDSPVGLPSLATLLTYVHAQAPDAEILVSGYPQLFGRPTTDCQVSTAAPIFVSADDIAFIRDETRSLDRAIAAGVRKASRNDPELQARYVDPTPFFAGHGLCDRRTSWVNGLLPSATAIPNPASFHPTALGQEAYAVSFVLGCRRPW